MYLRTLTVKNFRALADVTVEFSKGVNVIVGPNAIGKTTVLEAIRLAKSLLSQRVVSEAQQTLISLGGVSPHNPTQLIAENLAQQTDKSMEIRCGFQLSNEEVSLIRSGIESMATQLVRSRFSNNNIAELTSFLSSDEGKEAMNAAKSEIAEGLTKLEQASYVSRLDLIIDFAAGNIHSPDPIGASFIAFIDQILPFDRTKFSYFPADRALPRGEVNMQLGQPDASQQLESHNSQPQLKYARLKNIIFATIISGEEGRNAINKDFEEIFSSVLKGRELVGIGINQYGMMSVRIRDLSSGRIFDIDGLSSGEKGLLLTSLLISRTLANQSVVLLDEPELHLNPAVCKDLLSYMVDKYVVPKDIQMIICSHSPEILAGAFEREECSLYHLISSDKITKVRRTDHDEIAEALRRVGTSESEALLYKGTIFVEGPHDVELLETGFPQLLRQYRLKDLGGRKEIEKQIKSLQAAETEGKLPTKLFFAFDKDRKPTDLTHSPLIGVLQWTKYCLENYLIDMDALTDLLRDNSICSKPVSNQGELLVAIKPLAIAHLKEQIIRDVFDEMRPPSVGSPDDKDANLPFEEAALACFDRMRPAKDSLSSISESEWKNKFLERCKILERQLEPRWDTDWKNLCDGKRLFSEIQSKFSVRLPIITFKKRVISQMIINGDSENLSLLDNQIKGLLANGTTTQASV